MVWMRCARLFSSNESLNSAYDLIYVDMLLERTLQTIEIRCGYMLFDENGHNVIAKVRSRYSIVARPQSPKFVPYQVFYFQW